MLWFSWLFLLAPNYLLAEIPATFSATYEARYGGFKANARRQLHKLDNELVQIHNLLELKLLGQTVSSIEETSTVSFHSETGLSRSIDYSFIQTGIGKRSRQISFDWEKAIATATLDKLEIELALEGNVRDALSADLEVRNQLLMGNSDIVFPGIYKGELEEIHYRVIGSEEVSTALGRFNTVRLQRIREPESNRNTEIWLAPDWDYLLVKLVQEEPGSSTISLELREAVMDNQIVSPLPETIFGTGSTDNSN